MNTKAYLSVLVLVVTMSALSANAKEVQPKGFQQGTVVSVERQEVIKSQPMLLQRVRCTVADSVLLIRCFCEVGCGTYVGRYESYIDYLPSAFSANKEIPVRLTKHVMYFDVPGERDMKMGILHRSIDHAVPCDNGSASR